MELDYGILICTQKNRKYCGKSEITNKALYRVLYEVFTIKKEKKRIGLIDGKDYTFSKSFERKSEMDKFLKKG